VTRTLLAASVALAVFATAAPGALAGAANGGLPGAPSNPVAGVKWGTYKTDSTDPSLDPPSAYYNTARTAADRATFAKLLAVPRFRWFGAWVPTFNRGTKWGARKTAARYIEAVQRGDRGAAVGIGIFRLDPFEREACSRLPTGAEISDYKRWIQEFAAGIGDSRVIMLLQPDMPFTLCLPHHSQIDLQLISWTVKRFEALAHTTVYIDAGSSDWLKAGQTASMLKRAGVANARGFGLDLTHFDSTAHEVAYGKKVVKTLARLHVNGVHFAVNTSMNGRPFTTHQHRRTFKLGTVCKTRRSRACVTLGQPPTTNTGTSMCDAFLWFGRPWINNATRRPYDEVLRLVRTSPFF
jgi:endoglucanase